MLYESLDVENPNSNLFGRYIHEINLGRFDREKSIGFLQRGFEELNIKVGNDTLEEIYKIFDGIPGWLVFAGNSYYKKEI